MKTPYDAALRLRQREIDEVSEQIARTNNDLQQLDREGREIGRQMRREFQLAAAEHRFSAATSAYFARKRMELEAVDARTKEANSKLDELRNRAIQALGSMRSIEGAATHFRDEAGRVIARGEQSEADDLAAIGFLMSRRETRRSPQP